MPRHLNKDLLKDDALLLSFLWENSIPEPNTGCWLWLKALSSDGYAVNGIGYLHRAALRIKLGRAIERGKLACHKCDQPSCINPDHVYEGSAANNAADRSRRKRHPHVGKPTFTKEEAIQLHKRIIKGHPRRGARAVARELGVSAGAVLYAINKWGKRGGRLK